MEAIKKYVIDFVEGKVLASDFIRECEQNHKILDCIQTIVPEGKMTAKTTRYIDSNGNTNYKAESVPFDIDILWDELITKAKGHTILGKQLNIHSAIAKIVIEAFPNETINVDKTLDQKYDFLLDVMPKYICGEKSQELVEKIISETTINLIEKKRKKFIKEKIKEAFHLEGNNYPRWVQDSDWPFSKNGKPLKFISQRNKNLYVVELIFEDVDTGEKVTIEDIY